MQLWFCKQLTPNMSVAKIITQMHWLHDPFMATTVAVDDDKITSLIEPTWVVLIQLGKMRNRVHIWQNKKSFMSTFSLEWSMRSAKCYMHESGFIIYSRRWLNIFFNRESWTGNALFCFSVSKLNWKKNIFSHFPMHESLCKATCDSLLFGET
jgi:hypothetical protein